MVLPMTHIKKLLKFSLNMVIICAFILTSLLPASLQAQRGPSIIRDTEIETTFREWMRPLLKSAELGQGSVNLILVQDDQVNAFVAGGANIFFYTGLIEASDSPGEVIGVLAHEMGHIAGGHLISTRQALERASYESILGLVLGLGAALAGGGGDAGSAIISGSGSVTQRRFLAHTRINESSADQAALRFFERAGLNPEGLSSFLGKLQSQELLPVDKQTEYIRTHPLTRNRVEALQTKIAASPYVGQPLPAKWVDDHARMKAKILGFTDPGRVPWVYDDKDLSIPARYARTIAAYRQNKTVQAIEQIDQLLKIEPRNPYFFELKGQMLKDFGRVDEAVPFYREAAKILPNSGLIQIDLGHALLESRADKKKNTQEAVRTLQSALTHEPRASRAHRLLATAYGRQGQEALAKLHLAEEAVLQRRLPYAKQLTQTALESLEEGSREWIQAKDLLNHIENINRRG